MENYFTDDQFIVYRKLEPFHIASLKTRIENREQIPPLLERVRQACGPAICGKATVIIHGGAVKEGVLVEVAFPVREPVETPEIHTRMLEAATAFTTLHHGPSHTIRDTVAKVYDYLAKHAWSTSLQRREVFQVVNPAYPEKNITEVQVILHEWDRLFAEGVTNVLGMEACQKIMQADAQHRGIESITPDSTFAEYTAWIHGAIERLDTLTDDEEKKYQVVSRCAHIFPRERIEHLRTIYRQSGDFDDILREMYSDDFWYEKPLRRGNVLYMRKNPFDPENYQKATTRAEQRKAYCHCPFVRFYLEGGSRNRQRRPSLSPTFCLCGAGWYRQLWEGILGQEVKIEHVETLLRGNNQCTLTITLPLELEGECLPPA